MPIRLKVILSALIGTVVILIVVVIWQTTRFFQAQQASVSETPIIESPIEDNGGAPVDTEGPTNQNGAQNAPPVGQTPTQIPLQQPQEQPDEVTAKLVALTLPFVDRYGTFSNQNNFENIKDLFPYMTEDLKKKSELLIAEGASKPFPTSYTGVVTKALSYKVTSIDQTAGKGEFLVTTQRREYIGTPTNFKVYTQDIFVTFKKEDSVWLVDSATWK
ncbi:hypothetical protein HYW94_01460 [Candidatus Uhrbacteria bacterium]|nr:hypothetical protein [Candidatus Uhrbacteria bacterium]